MTIVSELSIAWMPIEKISLPVGLENSLLSNRLRWVGIGLGMLAFTHLRFRFGHPTASTWSSRITRRRDADSPTPAVTGIAGSTPISRPHVPRTCGLTTHELQTLAVVWNSFRTIGKSRGGLVLLASIAMLLVLSLPELMERRGVPLLPRIEHFQTFLTPPSASPRNLAWMVVPLLTVRCAAELAWGEPEAGLSEIADAAPVPEWVLFLGKSLGGSLALVKWLALLMTAGILVQVCMSSCNFEVWLYLKILFGLQLTTTSSSPCSPRWCT